MPAKQFDYKAQTAELEEILATLQANELDVDAAVALYERGMAIAEQLEAHLQKAENKITKVKAAWEARAKAL